MEGQPSRDASPATHRSLPPDGSQILGIIGWHTSRPASCVLGLLGSLAFSSLRRSLQSRDLPSPCSRLADPLSPLILLFRLCHPPPPVSQAF